MIDASIYSPHNVCTFDVETTYGSYLGRPGSPFSEGETGLCASGFLFPTRYKGNYLVTAGRDGIRKGVQRGSKEWLDSFPELGDTKVLVGHNIKFDLLWYWRHPRLEAFLKTGGRIWDTLYAEYLLSGQYYNLKSLPNLRPSLANTAKRRGCTLKLDVVKALWEDGVKTEDIQEHVLMEYQEGDCVTTQEIFHKQIAQAVRQNQLHMIHHRMDGLLATTEMEFNGLLIDVERAEELRVELERDIVALEERLSKYVPGNLPEEFEFKWTSSQQLSALIFGGTIKYKGTAIVRDASGEPVYYLKKIVEPVLDANGNQIFYKSGKNKGAIKTKKISVPDHARGPKTRKEDMLHTFPGYIEGKAKWRTGASKDETRSDFIRYSTSSEILEEVALLGVELVKDLLTKRGLEKDLGTYYRRFKNGKWSGMLTMVGNDGIVHHSLNHAITKTGRLSSSSPNLQNLSKKGKSKVRQTFISRFFGAGKVVEVDYSQLEVVCKCVLSGDEELKRKLISGLCQHCDWLSQMPFSDGKSYEEIYDLCKVQHDPVWTEKRSRVKPVTFSEAYGAGVPHMCEISGLDAEVIEAAIAERKRIYHRMYAYDEENIEKVKNSRKLSCNTTESGYQAGIGYLRSATDTVYHFVEGDAPGWMQHKGDMTSFNPTTIKNYPSQGLGGEIAQVQIGRVWRWLMAHDRFDDKFLLTNTVHDCCWADVHDDAIKHIATMKVIMEDVCAFFNKNYPNVEWDIPFPTEAEAGNTMYDLGPLHLEQPIEATL